MSARPFALRHPRIYATALRSAPYVAATLVYGAAAIVSALALVLLGLIARLVWVLFLAGWRA